jgi:F420-non-reducing hydrogenase large subunit
MSFKAKIEPLTRIEGHASVNIQIDEGKVKDVRMSVVESPRFFEYLLIGVEGREAPRISQRICGICYVAHSLASVKAIESAWGIKPPEKAENLRRLMHLGGVLSSHLLHLAYLATPDYLEGGAKFPYVKTSNPELFKALIDIYKFSNNLTETIGGRRIHIVTIVPGGIAKDISEEQIDNLRKETSGMIRKASNASEKLLKAFEKSSERFPATPAFRIAMTNNEQHELYDGEITVLDLHGDKAYSFKASECMDNIAEKSVEYSYVKYAYLRREGFPQGIYRTGCLPRMEAARRLKGEKAGELFKKYSDLFKPGRSLVAYNSARTIEVVSILEQIQDLLGKEPRENARIEVKPKKGVGIGLVEAPRGILMHQYETDTNGILTKANIITPTTQNAPTMERSIETYVEENIEKFTSLDTRETAVKEVEKLIRCYDPCISCSVHMTKIDH